MEWTWLLKLFNLFKGSSETKEIISGYKGLYETYKNEMLYWKQKAEALETEKTMPIEVKEHEQELLSKIIELTQKNWDLQEEIVFLKILKHSNGNKEKKVDKN